MAKAREAAVDSICKPPMPLWKTDPPALLSMQQAGWYLFRLDEPTAAKRVRRLITRGVIEPVIEGKRKWIPLSEIRKFLAREETPDDGA